MNLNNGVLDGIRRIGGRFRDITIDGGLPGAPLGFRLRGANTSGAPTTGTWKAGDETRDRGGNIYICTSGGTGAAATWVQAGNRGGWGVSAAGLGLGLLTIWPGLANNVNALANQDIFFQLVTATVTQTVSVLGTWIERAGVTTGTATNGMALYAEAGGAPIATTGSMATAFESIGYAEGSLGGSYGITQGSNYYLAVASSFTGTTPEMVCQANTEATFDSTGNEINGHYLGGYLTGEASFPSLTPSSLTLQANTYVMYAR
jgi:hypothetical protein